MIHKTIISKWYAWLKAGILSLIILVNFSLHAQKPDWKVVKGIEAPNSGDQQTASLVLDIDMDGKDDFVITERTSTPAVVWYKYNGTSFDRKVIHNQPLHIEAGGAFSDIDEDGDLDIVFGGDYKSNQIWWWENPNPEFNNPWKRHTIKNHGGRQHHDQIFGDFDHDGKQELVSWNQKDSVLYMFEIPTSPRTAKVWKYTAIYSGTGKDEGLAQADINGDGKMDIIGAGKWFEYNKGTEFTAHSIDPDMNYTRAAAGQLVKGGPIEIIFSPGDAIGNIKWYEMKNGKWESHVLDHIIHGHTIDVLDMDGDGNLDIFIGEMGNPGDGENADIIIYYGDGSGNFTKNIIRTGQGIHEGRIGDFNGDGIFDILVKPYNHNSPKVEVMFGIKK